MPALFFPNVDVLRLVLTSGAVPRELTSSPARYHRDDQGRVWLEPARPLQRPTLAALGRLGVQLLGSGGPCTESVACWAALIPLRPSPIPPASTHPQAVPPLVLFELPEQDLARFAARIRRRAAALLGVRLDCGTAPGRGWLT